MNFPSFLRNRTLRRFLIALIFLGGYLAFQRLNMESHALGVFGKLIPIEDVTGKVIITLSKNTQQEEKNRLSIRIQGELLGTAVVRQLYNGEEKASYVIGPGKVRLKIDKEWEYPKCSLAYEPRDVASGQLGVTYRFD